MPTVNRGVKRGQFPVEYRSILLVQDGLCQRRRKNQPFGRLQNQPLKSMKPHARRSPGMGLCYSGLGLFGLARPALGETV